MKHLSLGADPAQRVSGQRGLFYVYDSPQRQTQHSEYNSNVTEYTRTADAAVYAQPQPQSVTGTLSHGQSGHRQLQEQYDQHQQQQHEQQHGHAQQQQQQQHEQYANQNGYSAYSQRSSFRGSPKSGAVAKLKLKKSYQQRSHANYNRDVDRDRNDRDRNGMEPRRAQRLGYYWAK